MITGRPDGAATAPWIEPGLRRVGILGGTFDPVHYGHLVVAEQVREALELDRVFFVPAAQPPHKLDDDVSDASHRLAMVELAIAGNPGFAASRIELDREGPSFTVDTLAELAGEAEHQKVDREFYFILSAEALVSLRLWHKPERLLELARIAVVPRPGAPLPQSEWLAQNLPGGPASVERILCIDTVPLAHSATDVRARAASGRSIRYLVPPAVQAYIADHGLYRSSNQ